MKEKNGALRFFGELCRGQSIFKWNSNSNPSENNNTPNLPNCLKSKTDALAMARYFSDKNFNLSVAAYNVYLELVSQTNLNKEIENSDLDEIDTNLSHDSKACESKISESMKCKIPLCTTIVNNDKNCNTDSQVCKNEIYGFDILEIDSILSEINDALGKEVVLNWISDYDISKKELISSKNFVNYFDKPQFHVSKSGKYEKKLNLMNYLTRTCTNDDYELMVDPSDDTLLTSNPYLCSYDVMAVPMNMKLKKVNLSDSTKLYHAEKENNNVKSLDNGLQSERGNLSSQTTICSSDNSASRLPSFEFTPRSKDNRDHKNLNTPSNQCDFPILSDIRMKNNESIITSNDKFSEVHNGNIDYSCIENSIGKKSNIIAIEMTKLHNKHETLNGKSYQDDELSNKRTNYFSDGYLTTDEAAIYDEIGTLYFSNNCAEESLKYFEKAISLDRFNCHYIYRKGVVLQSLGYKTEAIYCFCKALKINQYYEPALFNLAVLLIDFLPRRSAAVFRILLQLNPSNTEVMNLLAQCYEKEGRLTEAIVYLNYALEMDSTNYSIRKKLQNIRAQSLMKSDSLPLSIDHHN